MSRTPVREALIRLHNEGLVEVVPRHGMRVLPVSPPTWTRSTRSSTSLESLAAEISRRSAGPRRRGAEAAGRRRTATMDERAQGRRSRRLGGGRRALPPDSWSSCAGNRLLAGVGLQLLGPRAPRAHVHAAPAPEADELDPRAPASSSSAIRARRRGRRPASSTARTASAARSSSTDILDATFRLPTSRKPNDCQPQLRHRRAARRRHRRRGDRRRRCRCSSALAPRRVVRASRFATHPGGALHYKATGEALPDATLAAAARRRRDPLRRDGLAGDPLRPTAPRSRRSSTCACALELYAGVRPARAIPGVALPLADPRARDIDLVLVRESTEGLFASRGKGEIIDDREARDTMVITRARRPSACTTSRSGSRSGASARGRPARVTCVDKANVFRSMAFFRKIFDERAARIPGRRGATTTTSTRRRSTWSASPGRSTCWSPRTCSATSCPTRPRRWSAAWAWRRRPTSATSTRCSSPATARRPTSPARARPTRRRRSCRRR